MAPKNGPGACTPGPTVSASGLRFRLRSIALRLRHLHPPLALAGVLTLAGIVGALAGRVSLAGIDTFTLHLAFLGAGGAYRHRREHDRSGRGQGNTGQYSGAHSGFSLVWDVEAPPIVAPRVQTPACRLGTTAAARTPGAATPCTGDRKSAYWIAADDRGAPFTPEKHLSHTARAAPQG